MPLTRFQLQFTHFLKTRARREVEKCFYFTILWLMFAKWSNFGHFLKFEKFQNSQNMVVLYITFKNMIWRFWICNLFCEIVKFCDFMNSFKNVAKHIVHKIVKYTYFAKQAIDWGSPDHMLTMYNVCSVPWGISWSMWGDIMMHVGGYLEYHGGCSVPWGISW